MKNKRIFSILLAATMLLPLASCGESSDAGSAPAGDTAASDGDLRAEETETEAESEFVPEQTDMEGFELVILNYTPSAFSWANTLITTEEQNGEILNDVAFQRESMTEEYLNCVITEVQTGDVVGAIKKTVSAGDHTYDTALVFDASITGAYAGGYLMTWDGVPGIHYENDYWDKGATDLYNIVGRQIAMDGAYSLYNYSTRHCYVVNKTMLGSLMPDVSPYSDVYDGKWTLDKLYQYGAAAESDINGDSVIDNSDRHGITGSIVRHYSQMLAGAGVTYIEKTEDGGLRFAIPGNEYAVSVLQKLVALNSGNTTYYLKKGAGIGDFDYNIFHNSLSLFQAAYIGEVAKTRDMDDDIGILPPPKFAETQENYYSLVEGGAQAVVPKTLSADRAVSVGKILDAFAFFSKRDEIPAYIEVIIKSKYARDDDAANMVQIIFDNAIYDLGVGAFSASFKNVYSDKVYKVREDNIASTTESIAQKGQAEIDKLISQISDLG